MLCNEINLIIDPYSPLSRIFLPKSYQTFVPQICRALWLDTGQKFEANTNFVRRKPGNIYIYLNISEITYLLQSDVRRNLWKHTLFLSGRCILQPLLSSPDPMLDSRVWLLICPSDWSALILSINLHRKVLLRSSRH